MIAGFELPTEGQILLQGQDVMRRAPFERDVNTGLPGLRPVPAPGRCSERGLRADDPQGAEGSPSGTGGRRPADGASRGLRPSKAEPAVRRPASARGARAWIFQRFRLANQVALVNVVGLVAILLSVAPVYVASRITQREATGRT